MRERASVDLAQLRADLGLPTVGRLTREQTLKLFTALDTGGEPIPDQAWAWARCTLGVQQAARSA